jgi:hypothetical protein
MEKLEVYRSNHYGLHAAIEAYKLELPEDTEVFKQEDNILITELGIYIAVWKND